MSFVYLFSCKGFEGALSAPSGRVANVPFLVCLSSAPFLSCLSSDLGGVWPFRIRCRRASFLSLSRLGCPTFFCLPNCPPTAVLYLSVLTVSKVQFQHRVEGLRTHRFLACRTSDLGGVWPFRICCQRASFLSLCRLGCATFFAHLLRSFTCLSFNGFEGAVSAPCGRVANALFLACLSSHLGGVWPFRIRCRRASFLSLSRLGCATFFAHLFAHLLRSVTCLSFNGFEGAETVSAPCGRVANALFLACLSSHLGGVWPFRIRCRRASFLSLSRLGCATFFAHLFAHLLRSFTSLSFNGFEGAVSAPCGRVANAPFLAYLSSDLGGVWPFRIRCRQASFLSLSRLGCPTFFAHLFAHLLRSFTCLF